MELQNIFNLRNLKVISFGKSVDEVLMLVLCNKEKEAFLLVRG